MSEHKSSHCHLGGLNGLQEGSFDPVFFQNLKKLTKSEENLVRFKFFVFSPLGAHQQKLYHEKLQT